VDEYETDTESMDVGDDSASDSDFDPMAPPREYIPDGESDTAMGDPHHAMPDNTVLPERSSQKPEDGSMDTLASSELVVLNSDDSADSDFDSDEVLSGDEAVFNKLEGWRAQGAPVEGLMPTL